MECPPDTQLIASIKKDSIATAPVTDTITLQGAQIIHSEVHSIAPSTNYATSGRLAVWSITNNNVPDTAHSFLKFDYSSVPSGITVNSAVLTLYADTSQVEVGQKGYTVLSGPNNWFIAPVATTWQATTINWNNAPGYYSANTINVPASASPFQTYTIDLTSLVKNELSQGPANFGIIMELVTESKWRGLAFYSPEGPAGLRPTLVITYQK